jgi:peptidyl-tRNA hydrolase, PTH1 family
MKLVLFKRKGTIFDMWTIVGLGNPGKEYERTRHNIAWLVLRALVKEKNLPSLHESGSLSSHVSEGMLEGKEVRIMLPTTFMNHSGSAVKKGLTEGIETLVVAHDEVDLPYGVVKIGMDRGAGGHNGVKSVIQSMGSSAFARIRIGVGKKNIFGIMRRPKGDALSDFVLGELTKKEESGLEAITEKVGKALELILGKGVQAAMQEINGS